ncbi:ABC transporter ATP-binding protein [Lysobacter soyae]|uniref:ABC transporter ATP-binding protein n=1 Tax=Lysobacter soyae TaxID=2764185 RepID=A0ABX8WMU4_9GAMM|nr:ABC transporter ATP-binding protein [Lysobacter sp. CJ11]QYR52738.1 ABC transporter ATP-binding protein [Lysobacter sp. CJ11]
MNEDLVRVQNAGKAYTKFRSTIHRILRWSGFNILPIEESWVLRHVSFSVRPGESLGIIGQNGAGKSTLLKMIVGTSWPSEGRVDVRGRVAALLELGLGFNPELSGRENSRHVCGMMGITGQDMEALIPDIEAFAEIGDYFDEPMRSYSSGMQMRVAFSVATAIRPDLLIVDEALSVGDAYFVHKCFKRMNEFRALGTSLLFVSHDPGAIQALCDRAIVLEKGRMILDAEPKAALDLYNALIAEKERSTISVQSGEQGISTASGTNEAVITSCRLLDSDGSQIEYAKVGDLIHLSVATEIRAEIPQMVFGYMIRDRLGQPVFGTNTSYTQQVVNSLKAGDRLTFDVSFKNSLGPGSYSFSVALSSTETHLVDNFHWKDLAVVFTVANTEYPFFIGCAHMPPTIQVVEFRGTHAH